MPYHIHKVHVSKAQMNRLARGASIMLKHSHLGGDVPIPLTEQHLKRIIKAHAKGKGVRLQLSESHLRHIAKHGEGFFADLLRGIKSAAKKGASYLRPIVEPHIRNIAAHAKDTASDVIGDSLGRASAAAHDKISEIGERARGKKGKGLFSFVRKVASKAIDPLVDVAENKLAGAAKGLVGGIPIVGKLAAPLIDKGLGAAANTVKKVVSGSGLPPLPSNAYPAEYRDFTPTVQPAKVRKGGGIRKKKGGALY